MDGDIIVAIGPLATRVANIIDHLANMGKLEDSENEEEYIEEAVELVEDIAQLYTDITIIKSYRPEYS